MIRLILFLLIVLAVAAGLHWLAESPGSIVIEWQDYVAQTTVFRAIVALMALVAAAVFAWSLLRSIWSSPAALGRYLHGRRQKKGLEAISSGIIAVGAGDRLLASRYASQARRALPNEPLTHLLRAQTAELTGDRTTSRRIFEAMLASPDTEQLGLRGLFLEAQRENEKEAQRQYAERALKLNTKLDWPVEALFDLQVGARDWPGALETVEIARRQKLIDKDVANRRRAVLLTAMSQPMEDATPQKALELAVEAHRLAPDLVPAAAIAGRILASQGSTPRTARVLLKTWRQSPHPDLATAYAYARPGDSPRDRLMRVRHLGRLTPHSSEANIAIAVTAIEAREWGEARKVLEPLLEDRLTQRVCTLMARIENGEHGAQGRVREWLARAVNAPRDPAWTADGVVSDRWAPVSPVTGALDAFRWHAPVEALDAKEGERLAAKVEALVALGAAPEGVLAPVPTASPVPPPAERPSIPDRAAPVPAQKITASPVSPAPLRTVAPPAQVEVARQFVTAAPPPSPKPVPQPLAPAASYTPKTARSAKKPATADAARKSTPQEPRIFVSPRAPDDPGADGPGAGEPGIEPFEGPFRPTTAKA